jgi:hypothetical protein
MSDIIRNLKVDPFPLPADSLDAKFSAVDSLKTVQRQADKANDRMTQHYHRASRQSHPQGGASVAPLGPLWVPGTTWVALP